MTQPFLNVHCKPLNIKWHMWPSVEKCPKITAAPHGLAMVYQSVLPYAERIPHPIDFSGQCSIHVYMSVADAFLISDLMVYALVNNWCRNALLGFDFLSLPLSFSIFFVSLSAAYWTFLKNEKNSLQGDASPSAKMNHLTTLSPTLYRAEREWDDTAQACSS